jgi:hypothetical protein
MKTKSGKEIGTKPDCPQRQLGSVEAESTFGELAAEFRKLTAGRRQTPSEVLLREGRGER